ncbi:unnamed protein product [Lupinus luteus]|uniref:Homeobox domain-containing protein n=1 Tax=Lupinus luteus TaxID=3873 RepID=A0AAV1X5X0_LUPLU
MSKTGGMADLVFGNRVEGNEMIMEEAPNSSDDDHALQQQQQQEEEEEGEEDQNQPAKRKKRYHRHSEYQIQQMEEFFKECPHPNDNQRKELSKHLKLDPSQVKFWFQNKRTQLKTQVERYNNHRLNEEIETLRAELERCQGALMKAACPTCGGPSTYGEMSFDEHHLRMENARLKEEVQRLSRMTSNHVVNVASSSYTGVSSSQNHRPSYDVGIGSYGVMPNMVRDMYGTDGCGSYLPTPLPVVPDPKKMMIVKLVDAAMEELTKLAMVGNPLWLPQNNQFTTEILNEDEYFRTFLSGFGPKLLGFKSEASKDSVVINKNNINLIEILMDVWDVLCTSALVQEKEHLATGRDSGNCISLIQVNQLQNEDQNMFILQESLTDATASYVVYAPVDVGPMNEVLSGGDPDFLGMLPSGFAVVPDGPLFSPPPQGGSIFNTGPRGSLITAAFQILLDNKPTSKLYPNLVSSVNDFVKFTIKKIKDSVTDDINKHLIGHRTVSKSTTRC